MQTFLPVPDFLESAKVLDYRRLGKQRVEALQLLRALAGQTKGWVNHPATRMWRGHDGALACYGLVMTGEWIRRGYKDTCYPKFMEFVERASNASLHMPPWMGDSAFHASHRSNLLRKDPFFYGWYGWTEPQDLPYVWPV